jgi:spermatogenesis-associated protein 2
VAASTLLSLHKVDPFYRFRLIQFYEVVESSLRSLSSASLRALHCAFSVLETVAINLFLYPWKKEFRSIKVRPPSFCPSCCPEGQSPCAFRAPSSGS